MFFLTIYLSVCRLSSRWGARHLLVLRIISDTILSRDWFAWIRTRGMMLGRETGTHLNQWTINPIYPVLITQNIQCWYTKKLNFLIGRSVILHLTNFSSYPWPHAPLSSSGIFQRYCDYILARFFLLSLFNFRDFSS